MDLSVKRQILLAIFVTAGFITWGLLFAMLPPIYPPEAEKKGVTPSQYGFVFGITHLTALIFSPLFSLYGETLGPKHLFIWGSIIQSLASIGFGFLTYIDDTWLFLGLSYLCRFLDGMADAGSWIAISSIMMRLYPDKVATITSLSETVFGLGYTTGPAVGTMLQSLGGFLVPFVSVGCLGLVVTFALIFIVPRVTGPDSVIEDSVQPPDEEDVSANQDESVETDDTVPIISAQNETHHPQAPAHISNSARRRSDSLQRIASATARATINRSGSHRVATSMYRGVSLNLFHALTNASIFVPFIDNVTCFAGIGFIESMLEPYLRTTVGASEKEVGLVFLTLGAVYSLMSPFVGFLCDRIRAPVMVSLLGNANLCFAFLILGPVPFLSPVLGQPSSTLVFVAVTLAAVGNSCVCVASFSRGHGSVRTLGFQGNLAMTLTLSGMWSTSFYLGGFLGSTLSGFLVEYLGFKNSLLIFVAIYGVMTVENLIECIVYLASQITLRREQSVEQLSNASVEA